MNPATHLVVVCRGDGSTTVEKRPTPQPGRGEILLGLRACGLCGTDLFKLDQPSMAGQVLGHELVGEILAAGSDVDPAFSHGARIVVPHHVACGECAQCRAGSETLCAEFRRDLLVPGGFSERILVQRRAVEAAAHVLPVGMPDETALFLEPAACVLRGIERSGLERYPDEGVDRAAAVLGGGSMGLLHLLVLRALLPGLAVWVSDPKPERRALARRLGAHPVAPQGLTDVAPSLGAGGFDAVFDTVGGPTLLDQALSLTREGGTVVLFAHAPAGSRAAFDLNTFFKTERQVVGTYSGSLAEQTRVWSLLSSGRLDPSPLVTHRLPLTRFDEAVDLAVRQEALKVALTPATSALTR